MSRDTLVELNVGGMVYTTASGTLLSHKRSLFSDLLKGPDSFTRDSKGRIFIDRDGVLFRYILDFLRNGFLTLPDNFHERERLCVEADFYGLHQIRGLVQELVPRKPQPGSGAIVVGYRGTFAFGRDGVADIKFRKLSRILVSGRVNVCRSVFGEVLNESRDPDLEPEGRYTCRYFLKHQSLEMAFERLQRAGFRLLGSCGSGTNGAGDPAKAALDTDETRWQHYSEFVWIRD